MGMVVGIAPKRRVPLSRVREIEASCRRPSQAAMA